MHTSLLVKMYKTLKSRKILDFRDTGNAKHFQVNQRFFVNLETSKKFPVSQKNRRFFSGSRKFVKFSRKSQIHMMETMAVLAIFFILVAIGLIFYSSVVTRNVAIEKEGNNQLNAVRIVQMASFLPELQCSQENIIIDNCIDILNLESMLEVINENQIYYFDKFSFSRIIVNKIYPDEEEWLLYNKPLEEYSGKSVTNTPMLLFDPIENRNSFGVMNIEVFSK